MISLKEPSVVLEAGCGVGNFILPFQQAFPSTYAYACDFAQNAIALLKEQPSYDPERCRAFVADCTEAESNSLLAEVPRDSVDVATLIFVLSAVAPDKMAQIIRNIKEVLKPGGSVLVRDYGLYDHAMLRFDKGKRIQAQFYARQDGTRAYYFTLEELESLFTGEGYEKRSCDYVHRRTVNKKEGVDVPRIFVQARFRNPL